ncbi:predicted protein [Lichtheimia corymbifera JMRC:FSU:9682]|uniref:F-box domain-containing protein n=1 Tax=Lichtheimia corymbifera JMRC:FSU:9682 TaxID=1263082 RepID=A0A068SF26_9FUNG|nr:predicted protein [Lichtheimia corymbifera JMRC:FSU:9682]
MSSVKHDVIQWVKRANSDAGLNGDHGNRRRRPTLRKVLEYVKLRRPKEDATTMQRRRSEGIDFVGELPMNIVTSKLIPMFMDDHVDTWGPCPYLDVSQRWRDRIFQCFQGLHFWLPHEEEHKTPRSIQLFQYPQLVKDMYIEWYGKYWMDVLLREGDFSSLRKLKVNGPSDTKECLVPTLRSVGRNLSQLTIHQLHVSLDDLLLACPKLTSLTLYVHYHIDFKCIALTTWPAIKELSITHNRIRRTTYDEVALICKSFPGLQKLDLCSCANMQCVLLVTDSFPCFKYFSIMAYRDGVRLHADY